jgi:hypothetical protein
VRRRPQSECLECIVRIAIVEVDADSKNEGEVSERPPWQQEWQSRFSRVGDGGGEHLRELGEGDGLGQGALIVLKHAVDLPQCFIEGESADVLERGGLVAEQGDGESGQGFRRRCELDNVNTTRCSSCERDSPGRRPISSCLARQPAVGQYCWRRAGLDKAQTHAVRCPSLRRGESRARSEIARLGPSLEDGRSIGERLSLGVFLCQRPTAGHAAKGHDGHSLAGSVGARG